MKIFNKLHLVGFITGLALITLLVVPAMGQGPIVNSVSVGGHDSVAPGWPRDASLALNAKQFEDGTVRGQLADKLAPQFQFVYHAEITCLSVSGNQAWASGVITQASNPFWIGAFEIILVSDNGTSKNDPPDQISFPFFGFEPAFNNCHAQYGDELMPHWDMPDGQVIVR